MHVAYNPIYLDKTGINEPQMRKCNKSEISLGKVSPGVSDGFWEYFHYGCYKGLCCIKSLSNRTKWNA
jgi:hypothetical protein